MLPNRSRSGKGAMKQGKCQSGEGSMRWSQGLNKLMKGHWQRKGGRVLLAFSACSQSKEEALQQLLDRCDVGQGEEVGNEGVGSVQSLQEGAKGVVSSWLPAMEGLTKAAGHNTTIASVCAGTLHKPAQGRWRHQRRLHHHSSRSRILGKTRLSPQRYHLRSLRPRWQQRPGPGSTACRSRRC